MGSREVKPYPSEKFNTIPGHRWATTRNEFIFMCGYCGGLDYPDVCGRCRSTDVKVYRRVPNDG